MYPLAFTLYYQFFTTNYQILNKDVITIPRSKFNVNTSKSAKNNRTINDITFDSDLEYRYYKYLLELKENNIIQGIIIQPKFILQEAYEKYGKKIRPIEYIADFEITYTNGETYIIDTKGMPTPDFKLKRKIFDFKYPDKILKVINYSKIDGGWVDLEVIEKGRKERKKLKEQNNKL